MCPNVNNTEVVAQFNAIVQQLGGQPLTIEEFKSAELRAQRVGTNYAAMELAYRIWDANQGEINSVDEAVKSYINQSQTSLKQQIDAINKRIPNTRVAEHLMSAKISGILQELFPELSVEYIASLTNGNIAEIDLGALKVLVDFVKGKRDSLPHEYAHYYYNMFRDSDLMKKGISVFGTEEALVKAIGKKVVEVEGEQRTWLQKFFDFIKSVFSKQWAKEALLCEITDAFLQRKDLGNKTKELFGIRYQSDENKPIEEVRMIFKKMANEIIYVDETHSYSTINGVKLTSVSNRKKEHGYNTYDDSLEDRDQKTISKQARDRGTAIHSIFEDVFKGNFSASKYTAFGITEEAAMNIKFTAENLMNYYDFVVSEAIVYDESIATAGTADLVMRDKQTGEYVLMDFKTKPGKLNGKQINKKGKALRGFDYVNSRRFSPKSHNDEYNFQLSLYSEMLSKRGIKISKKAIIPILYDVVDDSSGKQTLTKIYVSPTYGSRQDSEGKFVKTALNDKKSGVQWIAEDKMVETDIKARMYGDLSGFDNEKQGKRYLNAVDEASKLISKLRTKLQTQQKVQQAKGRSSLAYKTGRALQRLEDFQGLDALLSFVQFASTNLKTITDLLADFAKNSDKPNWSLSKLSQYYTISKAYDAVSEIKWYLNSYGDLFDEKEVAQLQSHLTQMSNYISTIQGYYNKEAKQKYLDTIVKGTAQKKARIVEQKSDEWTKLHRDKFSSKEEMRKARKEYIDKWVEDNEDYLNAEQAKWLEAQTLLADNVFEVIGISAYLTSVYEITDPFVTASVRVYDEGMQEVMHKTIAMRTRLDKATKAYLNKYGFGNLSNIKDVYEDFYEIAEDGSCYLVTAIPMSYRKALEEFENDMRSQHSLSADKRRQKRQEWQDENNPISDKEAYDNEFDTKLKNYLASIIDNDNKLEKTYKEIMENYTSKKMTWQKMLYVDKTNLTNDIADFLIKTQQQLDIKYRRPSNKFSNEKYDKMMSLAEDDPKRVLWQLLNEITNNEFRYNLPYRMRLNGRLPACNKSSYETLRTDGIVEATKLGFRDAFSMLEEEREMLRGEFIDELGNRVQQIAMPYVSKRLKSDKQSFNLPDIFLRYYEAAETYRIKSKMEDLILYTNMILATRQTKDRKGNELKLTNTYNLYKDWINQVFYDERLKDYGGFSIPGTDIQIDVAKFAKKIASFHSKKAMSFNMIAAISNILQGDTGNLEEAIAGKYITLNAMHKASAIFAKEIPTMLADAYRVTPQSKINKLAQWMHVFDGTENITIRGIMSNSLDDYAHMLSTMGEHWIQGRFMIAFLLNKDALDKDGNIIGNMWDMIDFDEDNQIKIDDRVANMTDADIDKLSLQLRRILIKMNGNYDQKRAANALENTIAGPFVMGLRRWVEPSFRRAWEPESYDDVLENHTGGMFRTLYRYIMYDATPATMQYFNIKYDESKHVKWRARRWGELEDWEIENLTRALTRLALIALAICAFWVIGSNVDDDDDESMSVSTTTMKYLSYRLYTDLTFMFNPVSFTKVIRDPFPALGLVDHIQAVLTQFTNPTEEYYSGRHMVDNKLLDKLTRLIPGARQLYRFENIENEMRYFISGN